MRACVSVCVHGDKSEESVPAGHSEVGSLGSPSGATAAIIAQTGNSGCKDSWQVSIRSGAASSRGRERQLGRCWLQKQHGGSRPAFHHRLRISGGKGQHPATSLFYSITARLFLVPSRRDPERIFI